MDSMIWVVAIGLFGYVLYAMVTAPPSSGCLSADLARARDEKKKADNARNQPRAAEAAPATTAAAVPAPAAVSLPDPAPITQADAISGRPTDGLRNPLTGETAAVPTNYRFAKRWIKDALVTEGLLEKVYANAELDAAAAEKVRAALAEFKKVAKYRA